MNQNQEQQQQSLLNGGRNQLELNKGQQSQERGLNRDQDFLESRSKGSKPVVTSTGFDLKKILTLTPPLTKGGIDDSNLVTSIGYTRSSLTTTTVSSITGLFTRPSLVQSLQPATVGDSTIGVIQTTTPRFGISSSSILSSSSKTSLKTNTTSSNDSTGKNENE